MLNSIILLGGLVSAFGLGAISPTQEKQDNVNFRLENHKSVQYNDDLYTVTLSYTEISYTYSNLFNFLIDGDFFSDIKFYYAVDSIGGAFIDFANTFNYDEYVVHDYVQYSNIDNDTAQAYIYFYYENNNFGFYATDGNTIDTETFLSGVNLLLLVENEDDTIYAGVKQAIELDIQANQPNPGVAGVMVQFVSILTDGIVSLGSGVANGIVSMASALFLDVDNGTVTGLSVFGGILAIFAGLALAIGITTKIYQWVTSLGN